MSKDGILTVILGAYHLLENSCWDDSCIMLSNFPPKELHFAFKLKCSLFKAWFPGLTFPDDSILREIQPGNSRIGKIIQEFAKFCSNRNIRSISASTPHFPNRFSGK